MLTTLAAALSLAASLAIDVPYLPQTDALCGGAAAAMVFRYWGDAHADAQEFAALVDRRAGGIANDALTRAIDGRGWRTAPAGDSLAALRARMLDRQPVIVLLPDRGSLYHYVVVVAATDDTVVVHDPSWGPSRSLRAPDFEREWKAAGYWSLLILPPAPPSGGDDRLRDRPDAGSAAGGSRPATIETECDARLDRALDEIRERGIESADAVLAEVRSRCPQSSGPLRELAGVRFAQRRWADASTLAREALIRDPHDEYALDVLGSSLFMQDDDVGALRAWNQIGKPRVNRVRIDGLHHVRYQTVAEVMDIQPNMLLTAEIFGRARRRVAALPDHALTRLAVKPESDGFATVDVVVVELSAVPRGTVEWAGVAARTLATRELDVAIPGATGQGEVWSAGWRWWSHRPGVNVGFAAPRVGRVPGVWKVDASWQSDAYASASNTRIVQSRTHGGLTVGDWLSGGVRYAVSAGVDAWSGGPKAASIGASLEHASFADRLSVSVDATQWAPIDGSGGFHSVAARALARTSTDARGWVARGAAGFERVGDSAPLGLWPGAGEGQARAPLLRAHPLLNDGVIDLEARSVFGRTLAFGSAEVQRWFERPAIVSVGWAGFVDVARASRQATAGTAAAQVDLGTGLRIRIPGTRGVLRADVAHGLRDGADALTIGWLF